MAVIARTAASQQFEALHAHGLTLELDVPEDLCVQADAAKITLALGNLLNNAGKFTPKGRVILRARPEGNNVVVTVTDTGVGLTDEAKSRLFTQFTQTEPLLTRHAEGLGLGLFVARLIIEAHGGRIFAESDGPGTGSTFGFTLPLAKCADPPQA